MTAGHVTCQPGYWYLPLWLSNSPIAPTTLDLLTVASLISNAPFPPPASFHPPLLFWPGSHHRHRSPSARFRFSFKNGAVGHAVAAGHHAAAKALRGGQAVLEPHGAVVVGANALPDVPPAMDHTATLSEQLSVEQPSTNQIALPLDPGVAAPPMSVWWE